MIDSDIRGLLLIRLRHRFLKIWTSIIGDPAQFFQRTRVQKTTGSVKEIDK